MRNQYLQFIGGKLHVQCREYIRPLISSYEKKLCRECGEKSTYTCSDENFIARVCRDCFKEIDQNVITFINPYSLTNNIEE